MRRRDKSKNIAKANLLAEQRYLKSKGLLKEDWEEDAFYANLLKNPNVKTYDSEAGRTFYVEGVDPRDKFYPSADSWMWNYCIFLGKFTDSKGVNYDLGIHVGELGGENDISGAIVGGDTAGDYASPSISGGSMFPQNEKAMETVTRARAAGYDIPPMQLLAPSKEDPNNYQPSGETF